MEEHICFTAISRVNEKEHFHYYTELVYVGTGECLAKVEDAEYRLHKKDIILFNAGERHALAADHNAILCRVTFQTSGREYFYCNRAADGSGTYRRLESLFERLIRDERMSQERPYLLESDLYAILDALYQSFCVQSKNRAETVQSADDAQRFRQILGIVDQKYRQKLSLSDLAGQMYVSTSTLSRAFYKQSGKHFKDYLREVRLSKGKEALLETDGNITGIAMDCGFADPASFSRAFEEAYGMTPTAYRKENAEQRGNKSAEENLLLSRLWNEQGEAREENAADKGGRAVCLDVSNTKPYRKIWNQVIAMGTAGDLMKARLREHLRTLHDELHFQYVRFWNVLSAGMMVSDGREETEPNFDHIDELLDFILKLGMKPFMDLGTRPNAALKKSHEYVFKRDEFICYESAGAFEKLMRSFFRHLVSRYGMSEVNLWRFEYSRDFSGEDIHFYKKPEDAALRYSRAFRLVLRTIREEIPAAVFGGPMMSLVNVENEEKQIRTFLEAIREEEKKIDFFSLMLFGDGQRREGEKSRNGAEENTPALAEGAVYEQRMLKKLHALLCEYGMEGTRVFIDEWSSSVSSRNYLNDSCFRSAYYCEKVRSLWNDVDLLVPWTGSDIVSNYIDTGLVFNGGNGLLTKDGIHKPAYQIFKLLDRMGQELIYKDENCIVTSTGRDDFFVLGYVYRKPGRRYEISGGVIDNPVRVRDVFDEGKGQTLDVTLCSLPEDGSYIVKKRTLSPRRNTLLRIFESFNYEEDLENGDINYLRQICRPQLTITRMNVRKGQITLTLDMDMLETTLIHLYPVRK